MKRGLYILSLLLILCSTVSFAQFCVDIQGEGLDTGLVSAWRGEDFDDVYGTNDGTAFGTVSVQDPTGRAEFGNAYRTNGSLDDYINVLYDSSLTPAGGLTISAWTRVEGLLNNRFAIDMFENTTEGGYGLRETGGSQGFGFLTTTGTVAQQLNTLNNPVIHGNWRHVTASWSPTTGTKIYLFGSTSNQWYNSDSNQTTLLHTSDDNFTIGRGWGFNDDGGWIDEVFFWDRALSDSEVATFYGSGDPICNYECGDGIIDPTETCDDGNTAGGDGCSATCQWDGGGCVDALVSNTVYTLTGNITSTGDCMDIGGDNTTLNCNGYTIGYSGGGGDKGVRVSGRNVTIENCIIEDFDDGISISSNDGDLLTVRNVTMRNINDNGIEGQGSNYEDMLITNVSIDAGDVGIYYTEGTNITIINSTIESTTGIEFGFAGGDQMFIADNQITNSDIGIRVSQVSTSNFLRNTITPDSPASSTTGIVLENGAGSNNLTGNIINITDGRGIAVVDQFFGTYYIEEFLGEWLPAGEVAFGIIPGERTHPVRIRAASTWPIRLRHDASIISAAHLDYIALVVNGSEVLPTSAINLDTNQSVLAKISSRDLDLADTLNQTIQLTFDGIPIGEYDLIMVGREEQKGSTREPLNFPLEGRLRDTYVTHTLGGGNVPTIDGEITIGDSYGSPEYTAFWETTTGHPDATNIWHVSNDATNMYVGFEFTSDNTDDAGVDWAAVYANVSGVRTEFRVNSTDNTYGEGKWTYTPTVAYQHKVFEFSIPLAELGATSGDDVQLAFAAYGTGGGGSPSTGNRLVANTITSNGTGILIENSNSQTLINNTVNAIGTSDSLEISAASSLTMSGNVFNGAYNFNSAGIDDWEVPNVGVLTPSTDYTCASSNSLADDLQITQGRIFANGDVACWDQESDLLFFNIQYDNPIVLVDGDGTGSFENCPSPVCQSPFYDSDFNEFYFTASGFSAYKIFNNGTGIPTSVTINESNSTPEVGDNVTFTADYVDVNSTIVPNATVTIDHCEIGSPTPMTFNVSGTNLWEYTFAFTSPGNCTWIVNATNPEGFNNGTVNDTLTIVNASGGGGPSLPSEPIPEFSDIALLLMLGLILGGFVKLRKRN